MFYLELSSGSILFRRCRETGVFEETELEEEEDLFEYVNDREYARIVQKRQEEGFILDDGERKMQQYGEGGVIYLLPLESNSNSIAASNEVLFLSRWDLLRTWT